MKRKHRRANLNNMSGQEQRNEFLRMKKCASQICALCLASVNVCHCFVHVLCFPFPFYDSYSPFFPLSPLPTFIIDVFTPSLHPLSLSIFVSLDFPSPLSLSLSQLSLIDAYTKRLSYLLCTNYRQCWRLDGGRTALTASSASSLTFDNTLSTNTNHHGHQQLNQPIAHRSTAIENVMPVLFPVPYLHRGASVWEERRVPTAGRQGKGKCVPANVNDVLIRIRQILL